MKVETIYKVILLILLLLSSKIFAVQFSVELHPEDDRFRSDKVKIFESKHIKNGALERFDPRSVDLDNVLMKYYIVINPPFTLDKRAIDELSKLAEKDLYVSMLNLGDIYSDVSLGHYNVYFAIKWYKRAVESRQSSQALDRLGYIHGVLLSDNKKAVEFYSRGCELKNASSCYNLSIVLSKFENEVKVIEALKKSYDLGHVKAGMNLYVLNKDSSTTKAIYYLKGSADRGDVEAQYFLGENYFFQKNMDLGLLYMTRSAEGGFVAAQAYLGRYYSEKINSKESFKLAEKWYLKAAIAGDEPSSKNLLALYNAYEELIPELREKRNYLIKIIEENKLN